MTRPVITCPLTDSLDEVARKMWTSDVGCLVVLDDAGHIAGLITDRDCLMAAHTRGQRLEAMQVDSAMSRSVYSCRPEDSLAAVEDVMKAHQIRRMPVVDAEGLPQGMITISDLARATEQPVGPAPSREGVAATLAAISAPRGGKA